MPHVNRPSRKMWRENGPHIPEQATGVRGPITGANLVDVEDPAYSHIVQAALKLIDFGFDPADPDIAERAIEVGRTDYEKDPRTLARRYARRSVEERYGTEAVAVNEVVYYMRIGNRVKIGWSTNLVTRLASINPEELMATEPGDRVLEKLRHREFAHLRTHGEWFRMEEPLIGHIVDLNRKTRKTA